MSTSSNSRDVRIRLESLWEGAGFDVATRSVSKFEGDYRRLAQMQMRAESEMADAIAKRAAEAEKANADQRDAMTKTGQVVLGFAGATAAGLALATREAMGWESAWAGVRKTVDGSAEEMAALEAELRTLATTTLPASHEEIAAVAEAAGQLGVARQDVAQFARVMIDLGETTNLSSDQAATALAQLMNIMGTAPDDVERLGSSIVALGNNSATTEADIVEMSQRIAGAGRLVGATETQVLATASALASMGVNAQAGGGSVSRILQRIYSDVQTGGDKLEAYAEVAGMTATDFAAAWEADPIRALAAFADGLNRVEGDGGNVIQTLRDLGIRSSEEARVILQLKSNTDLLTDSLDLAADAWEQNTALVDEAAQRYQTTEAKLQIARNQINDAAIDIGGNFLPVVADASAWVGQLATGFGDLPGPVKGFATALGTGVTGLGLLVGGAAIAIPKMYELQRTIEALGRGNSALGRGLGSTAKFLTGPWGIALAGAGVALALFIQKQGEAKLAAEGFRVTLDELGNTTDSTARKIYEDLVTATTSWFSDDIRLNGRTMVELMENIGVSAEDAAGYIQGNAEATERVNAAMSAFSDQHGGTGDFATFMSTGGSQVQALTGYLDEQRDALVAAEEQQQILIDAGVIAADVMSDNADATADAADATGEFGDAADMAAAEAEFLNEQMDEMIKLLRDLNSPVLNLRDAQRSWEEQLDRVTASIEKNGTSLDITSEAGRANQDVLDGLARSAMDLAAAVLEETESEEEFRSSLESSRQSLYETARRFGMSEDAAWKYVDSVLAIPDDATTIVDIETAQAQADLEKFLAAARNRHINIQARVFADPNYSPSTSQNLVARAGGGRIRGPGTETSDSILMRGSNNEHMIEAAAVRAMGGHDMVDAMRAGARAGTWDPIRGFGLPTGGGTVVTAPPASTAQTGAAGRPNLTVEGPLLNVERLDGSEPGAVGRELQWAFLGVK